MVHQRQQSNDDHNGLIFLLWLRLNFAYSMRKNFFVYRYIYFMHFRTHFARNTCDMRIRFRKQAKQECVINAHTFSSKGSITHWQF